LVAIALRPS